MFRLFFDSMHGMLQVKIAVRGGLLQAAGGYVLWSSWMELGASAVVAAAAAPVVARDCYAISVLPAAPSLLVWKRKKLPTIQQNEKPPKSQATDIL